MTWLIVAWLWQGLAYLSINFTQYVRRYNHHHHICITCTYLGKRKLKIRQACTQDIDRACIAIISNYKYKQEFRKLTWRNLKWICMNQKRGNLRMAKVVLNYKTHVHNRIQGERGEWDRHLLHWYQSMKQRFSVTKFIVQMMEDVVVLNLCASVLQWCDLRYASSIIVILKLCLTKKVVFYHFYNFLWFYRILPLLW